MDPQRTRKIFFKKLMRSEQAERASAGREATEGSGFKFIALLEGMSCIRCTNSTWSNDKCVFSGEGGMPSVDDLLLNRLPIFQML